MIRVGFQGEYGAFSETAAKRMVQEKAELVPFPDFPELFKAAARGKIDYAAVAMENALAGSVHENYDWLLKYRLLILKETTVRIVHNLIAPKGVSFSSIRHVYSHHMAIKQCRRFFEEHHRQLEPVHAYDTAGSVKMIVTKGLRDSAAIASAECAKISIVFATKNRAGALSDCLNILALRGINLTKIESRPLFGKPWEYLFYLDFTGNLGEPDILAAMRAVRKITDFMRILGCY